MKKTKQRPPKYIASCSFGKDSVATVLLAIEHGEPLDEICYCEVMYDNSRDISSEHPEHRAFIYEVAIPYFERKGVHTTVLRPEYDFIHEFYRKRQSGPYAGKYNGFPLSGLCIINKNCKMREINRYNTSIKRSGYTPIHYVGIAADEAKRLTRLKKSVDTSLLEKYGVTETQAEGICKRAGLYSPLYNYAKRGGLLVLSKCKRGGVATYLGITPGMALRAI